MSQRGLLWVLVALPGIATALVDDRVLLGDGIEVEATFNRPGLSGDPSTRVEDRLMELISQAAPGSEILVSIYTFRRVELAMALLDAQRRGVAVSVVVDNKSLRGRGRALQLLMEGSAEQPPLERCRDEPCVKVCRIGCHGFHINHNKFVLFSELDDGSRWVVAQSSANFTKGQHHQYNDLVVIKNDRKVYRAFADYFEDLGRRRWSPRYFRHKRGDGPIDVYFFPRLFGPDPIARMLGRVVCDSQSVIRVAHSRFGSSRAKVARRLKALAEQGCDVHVILRNEPGKGSPGSAVVDELDGLLTVLPYEGPEQDGTHNAIHTKLILIKAPFRGSQQRRHVVLTGSHNLSVTSLRLNDEVLLKLEDEALFESYEAFWNSILEAREGR